MANQTIDQLTDGGNIQTGDEIPAVRNGADYKIKANSILSRLDNLEISQGKNKGTFATANDLPIATNGDYAFVIATTSTWIYNNTWIDTEQDLKDNSLNKNNNLSELTDKAIARTNLDVYSKNEIDTSLDLKADKTTTYTKTDADTLLSNKVDKIPNKDLSTNDFDNNYKSQVDENTTNRHNHTNKALLDTYTQTEIDLADAVLKKHTHSNKTLLDTYTQTEVNLSDAVLKKHEHTNKTILDNITASFTTTQETKLAGIQNGATVNSTDAQLRDRSTHTGTQLASTISDFQTQVSANTDITTIKTGKNIKAWFISGGTNGSGNDTNNGYKPDNAFSTLSKLNATMGNTGEQAVFLPSQLTESVTFAQLNAEFTGHNASHRAICGTSGTITSNNGIGGSQTYSYLSIGTFVKTGAGYVTITDVTIPTGFSDNSTGVLDAYNLIFNAITPISITGTGIKNFYNQRGGIFTINNALAQVNIITNDYISQFTLTAGLMSLRNAIVYIAQGTTFTIGASGTTFIGENVRFLYPDNTIAKINIPAGCNYSLQLNCIFDRTNSTLNGTDISSLYQGYFANLATKNINFTNLTGNTILATDSNKNAQSLSTATYPSLTELSYIKGLSSAVQTQINAKENTFTKNTAFNKNFGNIAESICEGNDGRLGTKNIDETNIANGKIQVYNSTSGKLEYQDQNSETGASIYDKFKDNIIAGSNISLDKNDTNKTITINASGGGGGGTSSVNIITNNTTIADGQEYFVKTTNNDVILTIPDNASNNFSFKVCLDNINPVYKFYINLGNNIFIRDERRIAKEYTGTVLFAPYSRGSNISTMLKKVDGKFRLWIN